LSVDLSGHLSRDNLQDLASELNQKTIEGGVDLLINGASLVLSVCNSNVDELSIFGLLGSGEDEGRVGGSILRLIFADGCFSSVSCSGSRYWVASRRFGMNWRHKGVGRELAYKQSHLKHFVSFYFESCSAEEAYQSH
jgi:hypothetical protein